MVDAMPYIPFQRVKDWRAGDRIAVDGNPAKIRDIAQFENPSGSGEKMPPSVWNMTMSQG